jgi:hypothetical protein
MISERRKIETEEQKFENYSKYREHTGGESAEAFAVGDGDPYSARESEMQFDGSGYSAPTEPSIDVLSTPLP